MSFVKGGGNGSRRGVFLLKTSSRLIKHTGAGLLWLEHRRGGGWSGDLELGSGMGYCWSCIMGDSKGIGLGSDGWGEFEWYKYWWGGIGRGKCQGGRVKGVNGEMWTKLVLS